MNFAEISKARGQVIDNFVQIETLIASIISNFYVGRQNPYSFMFSLQVLYDENCSFGMKRNILKKILELIQLERNKKKEDGSNFEKLYKLNKVRNLFAHCGPDVFIAIEGQGKRITPSPQDPSTPIDFGGELQIFMKLFPEVFLWLNELLPEIDSLRERGLHNFYHTLTSHGPQSTPGISDAPVV